jgi:hypothetical protein
MGGTTISSLILSLGVERGVQLAKVFHFLDGREVADQLLLLCFCWVRVGSARVGRAAPRVVGRVFFLSLLPLSPCR